MTVISTRPRISCVLNIIFLIILSNACDGFSWKTPGPNRPPKSPQEEAKEQLLAGASNALLSPLAIASLLAYPLASKAYLPQEKPQVSESLIQQYPLGEAAYSKIGEMPICKIVNGMWQVSGAHGFDPQKEEAVAKMTYCADEGFTTFDLADIYGPAEDYVGLFRKGRLRSSVSDHCQFLTKWVPRPQEVSRKVAETAIDRSLRRMETGRIDLLQFHWWDYENKYYFDAIDYLMHLQQDDKIRYLGLTNFDTAHMLDLIEEGAPLLTNQVSFSVLDTRPLEKMIPMAKEKGVQLLCYGTLLGGFISSFWLGKPEPQFGDQASASLLNNVSLRKYLPWIRIWGGWDLFQELLQTLDVIARKYDVSISNVAERWVLEQPAVGGLTVGVRLGYRDHVKDNKKVFSFSLSDEDKEMIAKVQKKSKSLMKAFGDCGGEYRRRA